MEQAIILLHGAISNTFYTTVKPNLLCFNGKVSDQIKNENDKRGKTPRTAEFAIFGAPPQKNRKSEGEGGRAVLCAHAFIPYFCGMNTSFEMLGTDALQWAREISKLPEGYFTLCFFPYSRSRGEAGASGARNFPTNVLPFPLRTICSLATPKEIRRCVIVYWCDIWLFPMMDINFTR